MEPKIYTVLTFLKNEDDKFELSMHLVAGFSSADAQERIEKEAVHAQLGDRRFILTDERQEHFNNRASYFYVSGLTNDAPMSEHAFNVWAKVQTSNDFDCDENIGPCYREF